MFAVIWYVPGVLVAGMLLEKVICESKPLTYELCGPPYVTVNWGVLPALTV